MNRKLFLGHKLRPRFKNKRELRAYVKAWLDSYFEEQEAKRMLEFLASMRPEESWVGHVTYGEWTVKPLDDSQPQFTAIHRCYKDLKPSWPK